MTVKRYRAVASAAISLSDSGEYVKYEDYAALQAKVNALAVECGIMRQLLPDYVSVPATDAAIREIKAQGVDDLAVEFGLIAQSSKTHSIAYKAAKSAVFKCVAVAAKLRSGEVK